MRFSLNFFRPELTPLKSAPVHQDHYSSYWWEGNLVYVIAKKKKLTLQETKFQVEKFRRLLNGKHLCAIVDFSRVSESSPEVHNYIVEQLPNLFNAVALVTNDPGNGFTNNKKTFEGEKLPVKIFTKELDALCWVNQYLAN